MTSERHDDEWGLLHHKLTTSSLSSGHVAGIATLDDLADPNARIPESIQTIILVCGFPLLTGIVYSVRRWVLQPSGMVAGPIGLSEVIVWAVVVAMAVALWLSKVDRQHHFGSVVFGLVAGMALVDVVRTRILEPSGWVTQHLSLWESLAWTVVLGAGTALALSPRTQAWFQQMIRGVRLPRRTRIVVFAIGWVVAIAALFSFGAFVRYLGPMLFLVGLINGGVASVIVLPVAEKPFYKGLKTFLGGITIDNLGGADHTTAARFIAGIASSIQQLANALAAQFGSSIGNLQDSLRVSLWTTLSVVFAALLLASSGSKRNLS